MTTNELRQLKMIKTDPKEKHKMEMNITADEMNRQETTPNDVHHLIKCKHRKTRKFFMKMKMECTKTMRSDSD